MGSFKAQRGGGGLIIGFLLSKTIQKSSSTVKDDVKMFSHIRNDWRTSRVLQFKYCIFWFLPTIILKTGSLLYIGSLFHVKPWPYNTDLEFHPKVVGFSSKLLVSYCMSQNMISEGYKNVKPQQKKTFNSTKMSSLLLGHVSDEPMPWYTSRWTWEQRPPWSRK